MAHNTNTKRGEVMTQIGLEFRQNKEDLGNLISWEMGKKPTKGLGEVQEIIDICDFAVGLSKATLRLIYAFGAGATPHDGTIHPLGIVGIITAFNFPAAVWGWNSI